MSQLPQRMYVESSTLFGAANFGQLPQRKVLARLSSGGVERSRTSCEWPEGVMMDVAGPAAEADGGEERPSRSAEHAYYVKKEASLEDVKHRHAVFGYDPLDKALQKLKFEEEVAKRGPHSAYAEDVYKFKFEVLLKDHLETMKEMGLVYSHEFGEGSLGLSISVAQYGSGRKYVEVRQVAPDCPSSLVKPSDELIAIDDELIVDPTKENFHDIKRRIVDAPRPLKLTFVQGEDR